jgi:hypothetical protein
MRALTFLFSMLLQEYSHRCAQADSFLLSGRSNAAGCEALHYNARRGSVSNRRTRHKATRFVVKLELGGITGIIAPMIGKQPANADVWVVQGGAPAFVRSEEPLFLGGPIWKLKMISPLWDRASLNRRDSLFVPTKYNKARPGKSCITTLNN